MKGIKIFLLVIASLVDASKDKCLEGDAENILRHEDCNKFYKCISGVPLEFQCHSNFHFNLETWKCDWEFKVDCTNRNTATSTTSTTSTTTPALTSTETSSTTIPTSTETTLTTTPTSTTSITITTTASTTTTTTLASSTTTTQVPTTTTTSATSTTTTTQATTGNGDTLPNGCPVDPHVHRLVPHESDCSLFYYCVWGQLVLSECGLSGLSVNGRLHFNRDLQVCDWPSNAGC